jgi:hypothetical protein
MRVLRTLVLLASIAQVAVGAYIAYRLLWIEVPDLVGLLLCSAIIIAGLASLSCLHISPRPSLSRRSTVKLNLVILLLALVAASVMIGFEYNRGASTEKLQWFAMVFAIGATPFLVNGLALGVIERRVKKLA